MIYLALAIFMLLRHPHHPTPDWAVPILPTKRSPTFRYGLALEYTAQQEALRVETWPSGFAGGTGGHPDEQRRRCDWNGDGQVTYQDRLDFRDDWERGYGDFNRSGETNATDYRDSLTAFYAELPDFNGDGMVNSQDFFDFLGELFSPESAGR